MKVKPMRKGTKPIEGPAARLKPDDLIIRSDESIKEIAKATCDKLQEALGKS